MKDNERASVSLKKIISTAVLMLIIFLNFGVMATNNQVSNVKIVLSNGYEMNVLTNKKKVEDILSDNHIILLPEENVTPGKEEEISQNQTIHITKEQIAKQTEDNEDIEQILEEYTRYYRGNCGRGNTNTF